MQQASLLVRLLPINVCRCYARRMAGREVEGGVVERRVGANVRRARRDGDLSLGDLSKSLADVGMEISTHGLGRLERGARRVTVDDLVALATALRVDVTDLLRDQMDSGHRPGAVVAAGSAAPLSPEMQAAIDALITAATASLRAEVADIRAVVANASVGFSAHAVVNRSQTPTGEAQEPDA